MPSCMLARDRTVSADANSADWVEVCRVDDIRRDGARLLASASGTIALFRCHDDSVFALLNRCPHRQGPLSEGIVHGHAVTCPLHNWVIDLSTGQVVGPDTGCVPTIPVRVADGAVLLSKAHARAALAASADAVAS